MSLAAPSAQAACETAAGRHAEVLRAVERALDGLRFGSVQLTLHEGRVVQLDVTERQRFA